MELILGFVVGALAGWHFPQPTWAKLIIEWVKSKINSLDQQ